MDLWDIGRTVVKRWYLALPLVVVTVLLAVTMSGRINPEFSAETSLLLLGPGLGEVTDDVEVPPLGDTTDPTDLSNRYLSFPSSLTTMAQATQLSVSSDASRAMIAEEGLVADYEVTAEDRSPLLFVHVTSTDEEATLATMARVVELIEADLDERQDQEDAPADERIEMEVLASSQVGSADAGGRTQVRLTVLGLGLLLTIAIVVAFDTYSRRAGVPPPPPSSDGDRERSPAPTPLNGSVLDLGADDDDDWNWRPEPDELPRRSS